MKSAYLAAVCAMLAAAPALAQTTEAPAPAPQSVWPQSAPPVLAPPTPPQPTAAEAKKGEDALRAVITQFRAGNPDYANMSDELSGMIKPKADQVTNILTGLGHVTSVSVLGKNPDDGVLFFRVVFENGATDWAIKLGDDGKLEALAIRPAQPGT